MSERSGKIATEFMNVMKDQPLTLSLMVVVLALIGFIYYQGVAFIEMQHEAQKLLSQCIVPGGPK